ncbi:MAG: hypothetical protein WD336_09110 [Trueperaceae bacterium]
MDDLPALLDACRQAAGARSAALIGDDGLLIERIGDDEPPRLGGDEGVASDDVAWTAAEATDLCTVADRLVADAMGVGPARTVLVRTGETAVRLERCGDDAFLLLIGNDGAAGGPVASDLSDELRMRLREAVA